jgi:glycosyltransferase involved in cell wall biosynthesis
MKVLFVCSGNSGAVGFVVKRQLESLQSVGIDVDVFLIKGKGIKGYLKNIQPLKAYLKYRQYDVIHAHYSLSGFVASLAGARPITISLMGSDVHSNGLFKSVIGLFKVFSWKKVIVKSEEMNQSLGMKNCLVLPNGVDISVFKPLDQKACVKQLDWDETKVNILFPADPSRPEKNYEFAKSIVESLENENVELHFFKNVDPKQVPIYINAANVVLLTSLWEGSPNVIKESMACNKPIVTSRVGDVEHVLGDTEGCFIGDLDSKEQFLENLKSAISFYLENENTKGRDRILSIGFDSKSISEKLRGLYKSLMN